MGYHKTKRIGFFRLVESGQFIGNGKNEDALTGYNVVHPLYIGSLSILILSFQGSPEPYQRMILKLAHTFFVFILIFIIFVCPARD